MENTKKIYSIAPLNYKYPSLGPEDIPQKSVSVPISVVRLNEIQEHNIHYNVLFFHRLLKKYYGSPTQIEYDDVKRGTDSDGNTIVLLLWKEWKYFLRLPSGGIIKIGTADNHSSLEVSLILDDSASTILITEGQRLITEGQQFVKDLMVEAERLKGQILNPQKEFEEGDGTRNYHLDNAFKFNYDSAELMLEKAELYESELQQGFDNNSPHGATYAEDERGKEQLRDKYFAGFGMYYCAIILYYFMSFEGFINLLYHFLLKKELNGKELNLESRILSSIDLRISLLPVLCDGFKNQYFDRETEAFKQLCKLRDYRNQIAHSKITDSLRRIGFVEDNFLYNCDPNPQKESLFPRRKRLKREDVLTVKSIVDNMIEEIVQQLDDDSREFVKETVMKELAIRVFKDDIGKTYVGRTKYELKNQ